MTHLISSEFPLHSSTKKDSKPSPSRNVKIFPNLKYGNNVQSPSFLQLPNIFENQVARQNSYNNFPIRESNSLQSIPLDNRLSREGLGLIRVNSPKHNKYAIKSIMRNSNDSILIKPSLSPKESGYLPNLNEYSIKENEGVNQERLIKFEKKPVSDYNALINHEKVVKPPPLEIEKWGAFYDSYVYLAETPKGFKKKNGVFTGHLNQNFDHVGLQNVLRKTEKEEKYKKRRSLEGISKTTSEKTEENKTMSKVLQTESSSKKTQHNYQNFDTLARENIYNQSKENILASQNIKLFHKGSKMSDYAKKILSPSGSKPHLNDAFKKSLEVISKRNLTKLENLYNAQLFNKG